MKKQAISSSPWIWVALSVLSWSTVASASKWTLDFMHPFWMLFFSSFTASLILWILLSFHPFYTIKQRIKWKWIFLGLLNPFFYYLLLFEAYRTTPAQEALVLNYTWGILLALLSSIVFKKPLKINTISGMLISFAGVWVLISGGNFLLPHISWGNFLAFFSAFVWALYWVCNMKEEKTPLSALFVQFSTGALAILLFSLCFAPIPRIFPFYGMMGSIYLGFFEMSLPFFWWLLALRQSSSDPRMIHWIYLSPVLSMFWIGIFLKEAVSIYSWMGLILVLSGILLGKITFSTKKNLKTP